VQLTGCTRRLPASTASVNQLTTTLLSPGLTRYGNVRNAPGSRSGLCPELTGVPTRAKNAKQARTDRETRATLGRLRGRAGTGGEFVVLKRICSIKERGKACSFPVVDPVGYFLMGG